jgi:GNAT superfamily N-acetyltransferase
MSISIKIIEGDFKKPDHRESFVVLLNEYIKDEMGGGQIIKGARKEKILGEIGAHPSSLVLFALCDKMYVGMVVCFWGYSTFRVCPLLNVHDLIVLPAYRQKGIGKRLMDTVEEKAHASGCGKITLEVRHDNKQAHRLYRSLGYGECQPPMSFWVKHFESQP